MGLDDPEEEYDQIPAGYVQAMTVHQTKGLAFPVVFAGNLHYTPRTGSTYRLEERFRPYAHRGPSLPTTSEPNVTSSASCTSHTPARRRVATGMSSSCWDIHRRRR